MSIRRSYTANIYDIQTPAIFMKERHGFPQSKINFQVPNESKYDLGQFPQNIQELYWTKKGVPGESPWYGIGRLKNKLYFYLFAEASSKEKLFYDGLGTIQIYLAYNFDNILQFVLSESVNSLYVSETHL